MKIIGIIPARYASTRLPGKPLANILGKSMIQRVYEQCKKSTVLSELIIATDNKQILTHVHEFGGKAIMTSSTNPSGTDRCNEVIEKIEDEYDIVINIQGDEPFIHPEQINQIASLFDSQEIKITTLAKKILDNKILQDSNTPKAVFNKQGIALNFCRLINPSSKTDSHFKHIGIYGYRTQTLKEICSLPQSENEINERLEQLRWLDNNYVIKVGITTHESISIDTTEDIEKIKAQMR